MSAAALSAVGALVLAGVFQPESEGNRVLLPKDGAVLVQGQRSKANLTHHSGVYIPSSQCFFCTSKGGDRLRVEGRVWR